MDLAKRALHNNELGAYMKLTKRMQQVLDDHAKKGETSKFATAHKMQDLGLITITDQWVIRKGTPGQSTAGIKTGTWVIVFDINAPNKRGG